MEISFANVSGLSNDGGDPASKFFAPAECDTATYRDGRWFYGEHDKPRPLSELVKIYHETVGRNCFLELGMSPDRDGLVPSDHAKAYAELGAFIRQCYDHPVSPSRASLEDGKVHLAFDAPTTIDRIVLMEDQTNGQVIRSYTVTGREKFGEWHVLSKGTSVGHKKIDLFSKDVTVTEVRIKTTHVDTPKWKSISVHQCDRI